METNMRIENDCELYVASQNLLKAAYDYWKVYQKSVGSAAVVWLKDDSGHFVLFTRSEYKNDIMSVVDKLACEERLFDPFIKPEACNG